MKRGNRLSPPMEPEIEKFPLRPFFVAGNDMKIADVIFRFFCAVRDRWPIAWASNESGMILNRTNGFRALMRALLLICREVRPHSRMPEQADFDELLARVELRDEDFNVNTFSPGTSGESMLFRKLVDGMGLTKQKRLI